MILNYLLYILLKTVQAIMSGGHDHYTGVNE